MGNKNEKRLRGFLLKVKPLIYILITSFSVSLLTTQTLIYIYTINIIDFHVGELLNHSENVVIEQINALSSAEKIKGNECSISDLKTLKTISLQSQFISDIGKIQNGKVICSALWGSNEIPYNLDGGRLTKNGFTIWDGFRGFQVRDVQIDMTYIGASFIVTSPGAFSSYKKIEGILLETTDFNGKIIIHSFGKSNGVNISRVRCSKYFDFCIKGKKSYLLNINNNYHVSLFILFSFLIGAAVSFAHQKYTLINSSLGKRLTKALKEKKIHAHYQPIFNIKKGTITGFEALARWHDSIHGQVGPDVFMCEAKNSKIYNKINKYLLDLVLSDFDEILKKRMDIYLSINMDSKLLLEEGFICFFTLLIKDKNINPSQIAIEILESSTIGLDALASVVNELRRVGFKVFIDDFGVGYSSLSYLSSLNVDAVKIDKYFTQSAGTNSPTWLVLLKIIEITSTLKFMTIFEGIESHMQEYTILEHCCDAFGQGWLYSKAMPKEDVIKFLEHN
ncbi:EAL domain-containing protein (plasmid) [Klebsiella sp. WOUb02]|uniref:EAL domain-containing protein n=1 Tax=Klebsiella sp. WOUb02 TaxID=3161071 RepID=UPI003CE9D13C